MCLNTQRIYTSFLVQACLCRRKIFEFKLSHPFDTSAPRQSFDLNITFPFFLLQVFLNPVVLQVYQQVVLGLNPAAIKTLITMFKTNHKLNTPISMGTTTIAQKWIVLKSVSKNLQRKTITIIQNQRLNSPNLWLFTLMDLLVHRRLRFLERSTQYLQVNKTFSSKFYYQVVITHKNKVQWRGQGMYNPQTIPGYLGLLPSCYPHEEPKADPRSPGYPHGAMISKSTSILPFFSRI